jgi:hypothetical protein
MTIYLCAMGGALIVLLSAAMFLANLFLED